MRSVALSVRRAPTGLPCHSPSLRSPPVARARGARRSETPFTRRTLLEGGLLLGLIHHGLLPESGSAEAAVMKYSDISSGVTLDYPSNWTSSEVAPAKDFIPERTIVWYPKDTAPGDVNVTLLINNAGADFTGLGSFGSATDFGANLVNSMDRSYLLRGYLRPGQSQKDVQTAKLVSASSQRGMYSVEYLFRKPREETKRLISLVALRFDGTYNRLYTLTAQCLDSEYSKYQTDIQTVLASFKPPGSNP